MDLANHELLCWDPSICSEPFRNASHGVREDCKLCRLYDIIYSYFNHSSINTKSVFSLYLALWIDWCVDEIIRFSPVIVTNNAEKFIRALTLHNSIHRMLYIVHVLHEESVMCTTMKTWRWDCRTDVYTTESSLSFENAPIESLMTTQQCHLHFQLQKWH